MRNILAIAQKELRSYFASPIAYIVLGFWALLYGWFFITILAYFVRASMQAGQFGPLVIVRERAEEERDLHRIRRTTGRAGERGARGGRRDRNHGAEDQGDEER